MSPFGATLEKFRKERSIKQVELAQLLGIEQSYISAMERGHKGPPSDALLEKIASVLKLPRIEKRQLLHDAEISKLAFKIPQKTTRSEFELLHKLRKHLGTLNDRQVLVISTVLDMGSFEALDGEALMNN